MTYPPGAWDVDLEDRAGSWGPGRIGPARETGGRERWAPKYGPGMDEADKRELVKRFEAVDEMLRWLRAEVGCGAIPGDVKYHERSIDT